MATNRLLMAAIRLLVAANRLLVAVNRLLEEINRMLEAVNRMLEAVNRMLVVGNHPLGTASQQRWPVNQHQGNHHHLQSSRQQHLSSQLRVPTLRKPVIMTRTMAPNWQLPIFRIEWMRSKHS